MKCTALQILCFAEHMLFMGSADFPDENEVCLRKKFSLSILDLFNLLYVSA